MRFIVCVKCALSAICIPPRHLTQSKNILSSIASYLKISLQMLCVFQSVGPCAPLHHAKARYIPLSLFSCLIHNSIPAFQSSSFHLQLHHKFVYKRLSGSIQSCSPFVSLPFPCRALIQCHIVLHCRCKTHSRIIG